MKLSFVEFDPPAPLIRVILQHPSHLERTVQIDGIIDTGADICAIPSSLVPAMALSESAPIRISGIASKRHSYTTYIVNMEFAETRLIRRRVIVWDGNLVILGRDALEQFIFTYDGKSRQFEIQVVSL